MVFQGSEYFVRRSRGYVPQSVRLPRTCKPVLAMGGDLKSVFAYAKGNRAIPSQYFGDLDNLRNLEAYEQGLRFFADFLKLRPQKIICDLHPGYASTQYAERYAEELGVPLFKAQHHKAHFASAMADSGLNEKVVGIVADGTGYGEDGSIWGCEFFYGDYDAVERVGSLLPFDQPRGDAVAKNPLHMAALLLYALWRDEERVTRVLPASDELLPFVKAQLASPTLSVSSTSCGRLFDAAAALCGFTGKNTYEGEAAMRMESLAATTNDGSYEYDIVDDEILRLSWHFLGQMAEDKFQGVAPARMAARFHTTMAEALFAIAVQLCGRRSTDKVVFSGGTFQNRFLLTMLAEKLSAVGITPYYHRQVPANDGGLALGQIMIAMAGGE